MKPKYRNEIVMINLTNRKNEKNKRTEEGKQKIE
jgi:hypothetical protein